jgi:tetratricopeptide (TPR) repeat protein
MGITPKTVFISYRRTNFYTALAVYQDLTANGYDVFFDYESIDSGDFETVIFENIRYRAHFVVILSPSALERLGEKNSIMRREVELAIDEKRNIIPLMMESFDFGSPSVNAALIGKLASLSSYNGLKLEQEYFRAGMEKLRRFLNVELEAVRQPALSVAVEERTEKRQLKAKKEPVVQEESLTAEEWFERGYAFVENESYQEAIRWYLKAIELNPENAASYIALGIILFQKELELSLEAIETYPEDFLAYEDLEDNLERYNIIEEAYRKAIQIDSENSLAYTFLGSLLTHLKRCDEAEEAYRKAIQISPEDSSIHEELGNLLGELGRYDEAKEMFRKAIEIELARLHNQQDNPHEAISYLEKAIRLKPDRSIYYYYLGKIFERQENLQGAIENYDKAIEIEPKNIRFYRERISIHRKQGALEAAINDCNNSIALAPDDGYYYCVRGIIQKQRGNLQVAISDYDKSIELEPDNPYYFFFRGIARKKLGYHNKADADFGKAIRLHYEDHYSYYLRGDIREKQNKLESATIYYSQAIKINPDDAYYYYRRALVQKKRWRFFQAIRDYISFQLRSIRKGKWIITPNALEEDIRNKKMEEEMVNFESMIEEAIDELQFKSIF